MRKECCDVCATPFGSQPAYLVEGHRWGHRKWYRARLLICEACHSGQRAYWNSDHKTLKVGWMQVAGRGEQMPPTPCAACGALVIRNSDPLLKRVTCSQSCAASLTRIRNGNKGSGEPCDTCGEQITTGRADSRYCSQACRQKAYRRRKDSYVQP